MLDGASPLQKKDVVRRLGNRRSDSAATRCLLAIVGNFVRSIRELVVVDWSDYIFEQEVHRKLVSYHAPRRSPGAETPWFKKITD